MSPEEILSLPIRERRNIIDSLEDRLGYLKKLKEDNYTLPSDLEDLLDSLEKDRIKTLPKEEQLKIFNETKSNWSKIYPDFKRLSDLMEIFHNNELLIEYMSKSPPKSIQNKAIDMYKKCLSYKVKLTTRQIKSLVYHSTTGPYCINKKIVNNFVTEYKEWNRKIYELWNDIYYLKRDFFYNDGYKTNWRFQIKYLSEFLAKKVNEIEKSINEVIDLLNLGKDILNRHEIIITQEYINNSIEMSLYERELEISRIVDLNNENDEQYCYVYTLECKLFVFYVGIASDPKVRFEQHIRGAYSNESHLFKSKFIQKYHSQVRQNIIYEGIRKDCKIFEKNYIAEYQPLGNMTEGGEG